MATDSTALIRVVKGELVPGEEYRLALTDLSERAKKIHAITDKAVCEDAKYITKKGRDLTNAIIAAAEPERLRLQTALNDLREHRDRLIAEFTTVTDPLDRKVREWTLAEQAATKAEQDKINRGKRLAERVELKPDTPKVAGTAFRVRWRFRVLDASKIKREFLMPNDVEINSRIRKDADPETSERAVGGIKVWKE